MANLVKIDPPLPFTSPQAWQGFVTGLSPDAVHMGQVPPEPSSPQKIEIALPGQAGETVVLVGSWDQEGFLRVDPDRLDGLHDLLARLRKNQHIKICQTEDVEASTRYTGFEDVSLLPKALPEFDRHQLELSTTFLGRDFPLPLLITGMTGGVEQGQMINYRLAAAAQTFGIPMGVGSQRMALENPKLAKIFTVKDQAPDVFLIGNIGFAQLLTDESCDAVKRAVSMIEADALAIHVNALQEMVQVEGDRHFSGALERIEAVCAELKVPVLVKEVGCGLDLVTARALHQAGVAALDVGGGGGTSWSYIEGKRAHDPHTQRLGELFRDWGIPTAYSLSALHQANLGIPLVATGGIRDGLMVAKALALGASLAGIGLPLFRAALESASAPVKLLENIKRELEISMVCTGVKTVSQLNQRLRLSQRFREQMSGPYEQLL